MDPHLKDMERFVPSTLKPLYNQGPLRHYPARQGLLSGTVHCHGSNFVNKEPSAISGGINAQIPPVTCSQPVVLAQAISGLPGTVSSGQQRPRVGNELLDRLPTGETRRTDQCLASNRMAPWSSDGCCETLGVTRLSLSHQHNKWVNIYIYIY